jgi:hypothetical protein
MRSIFSVHHMSDTLLKEIKGSGKRGKSLRGVETFVQRGLVRKITARKRKRKSS